MNIETMYKFSHDTQKAIANLQAVIAANRGTDEASQATAASAVSAVAAIYERALPVLVVSGTPEELADFQRTLRTVPA